MTPLLLAVVLTGLITDSEGAAIANATVHVVSPAGPATRTDANGQFRFPELPAANVQLKIRAVGFTPYTGPAAPAIRLEVNPQFFCCDCEATPPRYTRKPAATASLRSHFYAERLDSNGEATLTPLSRKAPAIRLPLHQHSFEFPNLPPGRYSLRIAVPSYADFFIDKLDIPAKTETSIDADIVLEDCLSFTGPCPATRKLFRQKPGPPNRVCL